MRSIQLPAEPESIELDLDRTALLVVDMQNAFASPGGMLELAGIDIRPARDAVANARLVCEAARAAGIPVVYLTIGWPADQSTAGGPESPNPRKELALRLMREPVIVKSRYSGFHGTDLDSLLRGRAVRNLLIVGIASNVCVESTIRDAYFLEYWPVMIADATMPAGPAEIQRATIYNVSTFFGWVTTAEDVATALSGARLS